MKKKNNGPTGHIAHETISKDKQVLGIPKEKTQIIISHLRKALSSFVKVSAPYLFSKTYWEVRLKFAEWFLRKRLHNLSMYFHHIAIISFLKEKWPLFKSNLIVFTKGWFVSRVIKIGQGRVFLEKKYFHFILLFAWKGSWSIIWTHLVFSLTQNCLLRSLLKYKQFTMFHGIKMTTTMPTDNGQF